MDFFEKYDLSIATIPYPSAEQHEHTIYCVSRQNEEYGTLSCTVYDTILYIRNLDVPESHRGKGIARALLRYALRDQMNKNDTLTVSELDDHSDRPWDGPGNLYYEFGYRFKPDSDDEKTLDLTGILKII
jgi:predicted GNAT family acetyltransferase